MAEALAALNMALERAFGPGQVVADLLVKSGGDALVARGRDDLDSVIIKQFLGPDAAGLVAGMAADQAGRMVKGRLRLARWLRVSGALVVQELAPGVALAACLDGPGRAAALEDAGRWLAAFGADAAAPAAFNLHRVIKRRKEFTPADLPGPDRELTGAALAGLRGIARDLEGVPLLQTVVHGDLSPWNLHLAPGGVVWGYDARPARRRPVALDAAHLLVLAGLRWPLAGPRRDGLPAADRAALLTGCPQADGAVLRFFIGDRLLRSLAEWRGAAGHVAASRAALIHWLEAA